MKKYIIEIVETSRGYVEVEADSADKAEALAWEERENGNIAFVEEEIFIDSVKEV